MYTDILTIYLVDGRRYFVIESQNIYGIVVYLIVSMFHGARQDYSMYSSNYAVVRYSNIQSRDSPPTYLGLYRPSSWRYLTQEK
jgi:hypothetical protein